MNEVAEIKRAEIYQKNPLLQAPKNYDTLGWRLFELLISDVKPHLKNSKQFDTEFRTMTMETRDVIDLLTSEGTKRNDLYKRLQKTCNKMAGSYISIKVEDGFEAIPVFEIIKFTTKNGLLMRFNIQMKPYLIELEDGDYTHFKFRNALTLTSPNAIQLLEYLLEFSYFKKKKNPYYRDISYEDLRYIMGIKDSMYVDKKTGKPLKGVFVQYVIKKPLAEINKKLPYHIDFEPIKDKHDKRKTVGWRFWVTICEDAIDVPVEEPQQPEEHPEKEDDALAGVDEATQKLVKRMHELTENEKITEKAALSLVKKYGFERVKANFEFKRKTCHQKNGTRPSAALVSAACRDDYAGQAAMDAEIEKREKEHEAEKARREREAYETMKNLSQMLGGGAPHPADAPSGEDGGVSSVGDIISHLGEEHEGDGAMIRDFLMAELTVADARKLVTQGVDALSHYTKQRWSESKYTVDQVREWLVRHDSKEKKQS